MFGAWKLLFKPMKTFFNALENTYSSFVLFKKIKWMDGFIENTIIPSGIWADLFQLVFETRIDICHIFNMSYNIKAMPQAD